MTGLPYIGIDILGLINALETPALYNIYEQLYLAVTWEGATATWNGSSFTYTNRGGGYATAPNVTVGGNPATATIGTDPTNIVTFGRIISISYSGIASTVVIDPPPGGGWPTMNTVVQGYIGAANAEILAIQTSKQRLAEQMNTNWNLTGTQLTIEQRALATALPVGVPPVAAIDDLAQFPTTQYAFTDSVPQFALNTDPHMQAQSIEAIANLCLPGGQSIVGMMREARNQARLTQIGISLDNNISDSITTVENKTLLANGSINNTPPAKLGQVDCNTGDEVTANPYGFYDPEDNNYYVTNPVYLGAGGIGAGGNNTGNGWTGSGQVGGGSTPAVPTAVDVGNTGIYGGSLTGNNGSTGLEGNGLTGNQGGTGGTGGGVNGSNNGLLNGTSAVETGATTAYGSFAGSPYTNIIPANLNVLYTSKNLLPSTYTIPEAIDEVIRCNCDCWDMI
jgi:hypothetical protein